MNVIVFWDIDGTLLEDSPSSAPSVDLYRVATQQALKLTNDLPSVSSQGKTDLQTITEYVHAAGASPSLIPQVMRQFAALTSDEYLPDVHRLALPGIIDTLNRVTELGHHNSLLTGNTISHAQWKILSAGIDPNLFSWPYSCFGDNIPDRALLAPRAYAIAEDLNLIPLVIGDTPEDSRTAATCLIPFCGVATGEYTTAQLGKEQHSLVIPDFEIGATAFSALLAELSA